MKNNTRLILAIGSNTDAIKNISKVKIFLNELFLGKIFFSREVWTLPIDCFKSDLFLNLLAYTTTQMEYQEVEAEIKNVEKKMHSYKKDKLNGIVKIDIDILQYGNSKYHQNDWNRDYVKKLIMDFVK